MRGIWASCLCVKARPPSAYGLDKNHTYSVRYGMDDLDLRRSAGAYLLEAGI